MRRVRNRAGLLLVVLCAACATTRATVSRTIFDAGPHYVRLVELRTPDNEPAMRFDHPVDFTAGDMRWILSQFRLARTRIGGSQPAEAVFDPPAQQLLAPHLAKAFNTATDTEYVAFKVTIRIPALLLPKNGTTAGTMFVRDGEFHFQLEYFEALPDAVGQITYRPDRRTLRDAAQLEASADMRHVSPPDGGTPYGHWVALDWAALQSQLHARRQMRARVAADRERRAQRRTPRESDDWAVLDEATVMTEQGTLAVPEGTTRRMGCGTAAPRRRRPTGPL